MITKTINFITKFLVFGLLAVALLYLSVQQNGISASEVPVTKSFNLPLEIGTTYNFETISYNKSGYEGIYKLYNHGDFAHVPSVKNLFDYKGLLNVVYQNGNLLHIDRYTENLQLNSKIDLSLPLPLLGDIVSDDQGNYYVVCGQQDTSKKGGIPTVAVVKYSYSGTKIKTVEYITTASSTSTDAETPFKAGQCEAIITSNGEFVCSYAKEAYNGHQSNAVIRLDAATMKPMSAYPNYASHSLDQRVLELSDNGLCFINKGDAYPRGYGLEFYNTNRANTTSFHFAGDLGNNYVYSSLGGAVEANSNLFLVASSAKSLSASASTEPQNLFIQLVTDDDVSLASSVSRSGTSGDTWVKDKKILWVTDYENPYTVANPQVVKIDGERFIVMWEKIKKATKLENSEFVQSYYMIFNSDGTVSQGIESLNGIRLNSHETPLYRNGTVYWCTAGAFGKKSIEFAEYFVSGYGIIDGTKLHIHKLYIEPKAVKLTPTPVITGLTTNSKGVTLTWQPISGVAKYRVMRKAENGSWSFVGVSSTAKYVDSTAPGGKMYYYRVCCADSTGNQPISDFAESDIAVKSLCFADVPLNCWYSDSVAFCVLNEYFNGTGENQFAPNSGMTRAMFVQILYKFEGSPKITFKKIFSDVKSTDWFGYAVEWAYNFKVTSGLSVGIFGPNEFVSREQLATFLYSYAKNKNFDISASASLSRFEDLPEVSNWARTALSWAVAENFISGCTPTTISPKTSATRAQTAVIFKAFVNRYSA